MNIKLKKMCEEPDSVAALKFTPDWFVTSKMIKKLYTALYADYGLLFFDDESGNATFYCNEIDIFSVNLNNIDLDNNFDGDDPDTIIPIVLLAWHSKFKKLKAFKKELNEELMPVVWHPKR